MSRRGCREVCCHSWDSTEGRSPLVALDPLHFLLICWPIIARRRSDVLRRPGSPLLDCSTTTELSHNLNKQVITESYKERASQAKCLSSSSRSQPSLVVIYILLSVNLSTMVSLFSYLLTITLSLTGVAVLPVLAAPLPQEVVATSTVFVTSVIPVAAATPSSVITFGDLTVPSAGGTFGDFQVDPVKDVDSQRKFIILRHFGRWSHSISLHVQMSDSILFQRAYASDRQKVNVRSFPLSLSTYTKKHSHTSLTLCAGTPCAGTLCAGTGTLCARDRNVALADE